MAPVGRMNEDEETKKHMELLQRIPKQVLPELSRIDGVSKIIGVGSYYLPGNTNVTPNDLDYLLVMDSSFTDTENMRSLGEFLEQFQEQYPPEGITKNERSLISIFLKDIDGFFLKGEDLWNWFNDDFGFTREELQVKADETEQYRTGWESAPVLWDRDR